MIIVMLMTVTLLMALEAGAWRVNEADVRRASVGIRWILRDQGAGPSDYRVLSAWDYAWIIAPISKKFGVDIDAMVVTAYSESSFHVDAVGKAGEFGLYQINPRKKRMKNWKNVRENASRGARILALAIQECSAEGKNTWEHVFGHYRSGECRKEYGKKKGRLLRRLKAALGENDG